MTGPNSFFLDLDWERVTGAYAREGLVEEANSAARALARAIASSPGWGAYPPGVVVVREGSPPLLGIVFEETVSDIRSLEVRAGHLPLALDLLRFRGWERVVEDATLLADLLRTELPEDDLRRARWIAIPRGGRIVLGLLSYLLDLPGRPPRRKERSPVVIVDDCVLSGRRLGEQLAGLDRAEPVFVATLYSHPELRRTIVAREPRVGRVLSARDLEDHASERYGEDEESWRKRWVERDGPEAYWIGLPDHVCFPWNEPDTGLWNGTEEILAWRVLPPEVCLKNLGRPGDSLEVSVMDDEGGYMIPARDVLSARVEEALVVAKRGAGRCLHLSGSGARMWEVVTEAPDRRAAVEVLTDQFAVADATIESDVREFEDRLVALRILEGRS